MNTNHRTLSLKFTAALAVLLLAAYAQAAGSLRVTPARFDCGTVDEGVPAVMKATVENVGGQDVHVLNVRTN